MECYICEKTFPDYTTLLQHKKAEHRTILLRSSSKRKAPSDDNPDAVKRTKTANEKPAENQKLKDDLFTERVKGLKTIPREGKFR